MLTFIRDNGMQYAKSSSLKKYRQYIVLCPGCNKKHKIQAQQFKAGYTEYCLECSKKKRKKSENNKR